jgi:hypothetical protein
VVAGQLRRSAAAANPLVLRCAVAHLLEVVGAEAELAGSALDERVAEPGQVA